MLNFKQFLLEESNEQFAYLDLWILYDDVVDSRIQALIMKTVDDLKIPGLQIVGYSADTLNIEIHFNLNWLRTNQQLLHQYETTILKTIRPILKPVTLQLSNVKSNLSIRMIPDYVIEWDDVAIYAQHNSSLKDIDKFIKCKKLVINDGNNIKSNVLGLLKMKCEIELWSESKWKKIVEKYLNGDKNLLACQEELMDNGLKEYAKL